MRWVSSLKVRYGTKVFMAFSFILTIIVVLFSFTVYTIFAKDRTDAIVEANLRTLSMTSFSADFMHTNALELLISQFSNPQNQLMMYGDFVDALTLKEQRDKLIVQVAANQFVHSIHVYNQKQDRVISTSWQSVSTRSSFYDQELMQLLRTPMERITPIARQIPTLKSHEMEDVYTYVLYDYYNADTGIDGAVVLNIKSSYLADLMHSFNREQQRDESRSVFIVNQNGMVVSPAIMKEEQLSDPLTQVIVAKVLSNNDSSGYFIYKHENVSYLVTHVNSSSLGWKFIDIQNYDQQIAVVNKLKAYTIGIAVVVLAIGLLISFIVSNRLTGPLKQLLRLIKSSSNHLGLPSEPVNELTALEMVLHKTLPFYQHGAALRKNESLKSLLQSEHRAGSHIQTMKRHKVKVDFSQPYFMIILDLDHFNAFVCRYSTSDQELLRYALSKAIAEHLDRNELSGEVINYSERRQVLLLNWSQEKIEEAIPEGIQVLLSSMQEWVFSNLNLSLTLSVGHSSGEQAMIDVYNEASYIAQYRFLIGHKSILSSDSLNPYHQDEVYRFPQAMETALSDAVLTGNYEACTEQLRLIIHTLRSKRYEIVISNVRYLLFFLYNLSHAIPGSNQAENFDLNSYFHHLDGLETLSEVEVFFQETMYEATQAVKERRENRSAVISAHIVAYIESSFRDPNLCTDTIAEHLNFSNVYIRKVFRETHAKTIGDYILDCRIQKVIEGLAERDIPIDQLLEESGIDNKKYFASLFKKRTGLSLRDFRLQAAEQANCSNSM